MTRKGKIARLPRGIRDELNRWLDDGEQGVRLVEWLNGLPEVKKVLESDFEGRAITDGNLADWKNGGFVDWQASQETRAVIEEWKSGGEESAAPAELAELFTTVLMSHYAVAVRRSNADAAEEPRERLKRLGKSLRDITRLRRCELARERNREQAEIGRERVELMRQRLELERARMKHPPEGSETDAEPQPSHEERAEMVREMVREARARMEAEERAKSGQIRDKKIFSALVDKENSYLENPVERIRPPQRPTCRILVRE